MLIAMVFVAAGVAAGIGLLSRSALTAGRWSARLLGLHTEAELAQLFVLCSKMCEEAGR